MYRGISLELFSGSCNVSKALQEFGFDAWSVDNNPKLNPRLCGDILNFDPSILPGQCDFFWASPDCAIFSRIGDKKHWLKTTPKYRIYNYKPLSSKALLSIELLQKTIDLILFLKPKVWFIENPVGRMHHMPCMKKLGHYRYGINYKDFGFDYSKETYLFTNQLLPLSQKKVIRPGKSVIDIRSHYDRSKVPPALVHFLLNQIYS